VSRDTRVARHRRAHMHPIITGLALIAAAAGGADAAAASCTPVNTAYTGSSAAVSDIPPDYLALYRQAGSTCAGLDWAVLAAIGKIESDHGRIPLPGVRSGANPWGAMGPMQFEAATWADVRRRHSEIGADVYAAANAVPGAAHLLCDNGATGHLRDSIFAYNHSAKYVTDVLNQAAAYRTAA
jgi:hypothetical protein